MKYFNNKDIQEYLSQNFVKVDGLWFLKVEELYGFDKALEIDREVWKVIPKLQARFIKKRLLEAKNTGNDIIPGSDFKTIQKLLFEALKIKLAIDGFEFKISKNKTGLNVNITKCPWHEIMVRAKREKLSENIGSAICSVEYAAFIKEFSPDALYYLNSKLCSGCEYCDFKFSLK